MWMSGIDVWSDEGIDWIVEESKDYGGWLWNVYRLKGGWSIQPYRGVKSSHVLAGLSVLGLFISDSITVSLSLFFVLHLFLSRQPHGPPLFFVIKRKSWERKQMRWALKRFVPRPARIIFNLSIYKESFATAVHFTFTVVAWVSPLFF